MERCGWYLTCNGISLLTTICYLMLPPGETNTVKVFENSWKITNEETDCGSICARFYQCSWWGTLEYQYSSAMFPDSPVVLQSEKMECISFCVIHVNHDNSCYTANGLVNVYRRVQVLGGFTPVDLILCFSQRTAAVSLWACSGVGLIDGLSFFTSTKSVELS